LTDQILDILIRTRDCIDEAICRFDVSMEDEILNLKIDKEKLNKLIDDAWCFDVAFSYFKEALAEVRILDTNPEPPSRINRAHFYLTEGIELIEHPEGRTLKERCEEKQ